MSLSIAHTQLAVIVSSSGEQTCSAWSHKSQFDDYHVTCYQLIELKSALLFKSFRNSTSFRNTNLLLYYLQSINQNHWYPSLTWAKWTYMKWIPWNVCYFAVNCSVVFVKYRLYSISDHSGNRKTLKWPCRKFRYWNEITKNWRAVCGSLVHLDLCGNMD